MPDITKLTIYSLECKACGSVYGLTATYERLKPGDICPNDMCPSHHEELGKPDPTQPGYVEPECMPCCKCGNIVESWIYSMCGSCMAKEYEE